MTFSKCGVIPLKAFVTLLRLEVFLTWELSNDVQWFHNAHSLFVVIL